MASSAPFDVHKLFRPPTPMPGPTSSGPNPSNPVGGGGGGGGFPQPSPSSSPYSVPLQTPPLHGAYSYPPATPPFHHPAFLHYPQDTLHRSPISYPSPPPPHLPNPSSGPGPSPNSNPNPGARLMALLGTTASPSHLDTAISMPRPSSMPQEFSMAPPIVHAPPSAPPQQPSGVPMAAVSRAPSGKAPRGRHLGPGERVSYDVDSRLPGEAQPPQLEVTPITKYASDPGLVLGRQIAVNRTYICYGLKLGAIRVLNINTALRSLLRGHNQRVTDMAFFAEDVHILASASVDGRVFVWKIDEGPNEEDKPQITGRIVIAIQIIGDGESYHPRVCWHSHKQEILMVGIGNRVLKIDTTKVGRGKEFSAEEPLRCPLDKLIDGMQFIGKHDAEVTDLSISQWMITRLASASKDGTVKIWDDRKAMPLVTLRPHDGQPVNSVAFLTAPNRPEHIVLVTAGPLNREVKIWVSAGEEGWLLPSESESWHCTQTLDLRSSAEPRQEEAFFNQVVVLPRASLILLANAKKNAIYAVHVDYGLFPASTHMDYIADFTVAMPILSLTGTSDCFSDGEQVVQVYCVQTQAIQQYALDLSLCLPPPVDTSGLGKDTGSSQVSDAHSSEEISQPESSIVHAMNDLPVGSASLNTFHLMSSSDNSLPSVPEGIRMQELASSNAEAKPSAPPLASADTDTAHSSSFAAPLTLDPLGGLSTLRSPGKGFERGPVFCDRNVDQSVLDYTVDRRVDAGIANVANAPSIEENSGKHEFKLGPNDVSALPNPSAMIKLGGNTTHLITPFEILSGALSSESSLVDHTMKGEEVKVQDMVINNDLENVEVEIKVVGESGVGQHEDFDCRKEPQALPTENMDSSQTLETNGETAKECSSLTAENYTIVEARRIDDVAIMEALESSPSTAEDQVQDGTKDVSEKATEASASTVTQFISTTKGKKQKVIQSQGSGSLSPSPSPFNSTDSLNETGSSAGAPSLDAALSQILTMQEALNQLMIMQKEMQKQISVMVAVPLNKEGRRMEAALGRIMEKAVKANVDALWARLQEENAKHEKIERDRVQHLTNLITNSMSKDFPAMLERALKKEFLALGPNLARAITPVVEKAISSAIADSFQRGIGDKAMNQLEKSINSKLEGTVARQIQAQFQTSGKQALQDALRSTLESSVIPAFEMSCKVMFEQVDAAFQKGMSEHTTAAQQQVESAYTPLALTLRDAINSASSITQNISSELADGQRKLLALVAAGNTKALNPLALQQNNGPMGSHLDMQVEASLDPTKELTRLISEHKFGEAFTLALHRSNVSIVSWLCSQVDLQAILSTLPSPLSQGVLLSLLQQLACDISNDTTRKLDWMTTVASAIIPGDPSISVHVRRIIDQVSVMLGQQRSLPTTTPMEGMKIRLLMHVLTSILANCK